jgi:hypothetical protein
MTDFRLIVTGVTPQDRETNLNNWLLDPAGDGSVSPLIQQDPETKAYHPTKGVSMYRYTDDDGRDRCDVRVFGQKAVEDADAFVAHPTKGVDVQDSKVRKSFRTRADDITKPTSIRQAQTIQRKRPTYDEDGNVTGEETWASGSVEAIVDRGVVLLGDEYDGDLGNPLLVEHIWYGDVL